MRNCQNPKNAKILTTDGRFTAFLKFTVAKMEEEEKLVHRIDPDDAGLEENPQYPFFFTPQSYAMIFHSLGKLNLPMNDDILAIATFVENRSNYIVKNGIPQDIAMCSLSFARLNIPAPRFFAVVGRRGDLMVRDGDSQHCANVCWSFAKLNNTTSSPLFFKAVANGGILVKDGNPLTVANTTWAFSELNFDVRGLEESKGSYFAALEEKGQWLVDEGNSQTVANTARALAKLQIAAPIFFAAVEQSNLQLVQHANAQAVSNTAWALGTNHASFALDQDKKEGTPKYIRPVIPYIAAVNDDAQRLVQTGNTQAIANTAWAIAKLGVLAPQYFRWVSLKYASIVSGGSHQEVSSIVHSFAKVDFQANDLFEAVEGRTEWLFEQGTTSNIANVAWAFATSGYRGNGNFFGTIDSEGDKLVENGQVRELAAIAWALAKRRVRAPSFFEALDRNATRLVPTAKNHELANLCWALSMFDIQSFNFFEAVDERAEWLVEEGDEEVVRMIKSAFWKVGISAPKLKEACEKNGW